MGYFVFKPSFLVIFFYTNLMNAEYSVKKKKENNFRVKVKPVISETRCIWRYQESLILDIWSLIEFPVQGPAGFIPNKVLI